MFQHDTLIKCEPLHEKTGFCICENIGADQLSGYGAADLHLCFRYIDRIIPPNFKPLTISCGFTVWFTVSDLVRNLEDRFPHDTAHIRNSIVSVILTGFINI